MEKPKKPTSLLNNMASVKNLNKGINGKKPAKLSSQR